MFKKIRKNLPYWLEKLPDIPQLIYDNLNAGAHRQIIQIQQMDQKKIRSGRRWGFLLGVVVTALIFAIMVHFHMAPLAHYVH